MTRTQLLQEIRRMRFVEAYVGWQALRLTQGEAARLLGVCDRTFRRYVDRYEDEGLEGLEGLDGLDGLVDKRLGQVSARRAPVAEVVRTEALYRERYEGWSVKHFYSFYRREHDGERSYTWAPGGSTRWRRRTGTWPNTTASRSTRSSRCRRRRPAARLCPSSVRVWPTFCASIMSARSIGTTACVSRAGGCRSPPRRIAATLSRRGCGCTATPTDTWPCSTDRASWPLPRHHRRDRLLPNVLPLVQHRASPWRDRDAHPGRRPSSSNPERAGPARADPSSRLDPSPRTLRSRHPKTRPPSRSGLDQPTRDIQNGRDCSVNRNRQCLKVVDRFRNGNPEVRTGKLGKTPAFVADFIK